ncbi:MAG: class I SAM-dependent methyltransferase [bacterium]
MEVRIAGRELIDSEKLISGLKISGGCFVDVCSGGHGHFVVPAAREAGSGRVVAVDISAKILEALAWHLNQHNLENVELLRGDVERYRGVPLKNEEADVVLLANYFHLLSAPTLALEEIARILNIDGRLVIVGPKKESPFYGLANTRKMSEDVIRLFLLEHGFAQTRTFSAGPHHFCAVFQKV